MTGKDWMNDGEAIFVTPVRGEEESIDEKQLMAKYHPFCEELLVVRVRKSRPAERLVVMKSKVIDTEGIISISRSPRSFLRFPLYPKESRTLVTMTRS